MKQLERDMDHRTGDINELVIDSDQMGTIINQLKWCRKDFSVTSQWSG